MEQRRRIVLAFTALVLAAWAMGVSPILVRWAEVGPYASASWRTAPALLWAGIETRCGAPFAYDRAVLLAGLLFGVLTAVFFGANMLAVRAALIFIEAIAAAGLGWLLLGEPVGALQAAGGVLILAGIFLAPPRARAIAAVGAAA